MFDYHKTKLIQCPCGNNIIVYAHTEPNEKSVYGFTSIVELIGSVKLDDFSNAVCVCGKKHGLKRFSGQFHASAIKYHATEPAPLEMKQERMF